MSHELTEKNQKLSKRPKIAEQILNQQPLSGSKPAEAKMLGLQKKAGNQAVQRLLAQRKGSEGFDLDQNTAGRINNARGDGQPLDGAVQARMSEQLGHDFSGVRVHTSTESDTLNKELSAKAFTTGQDIFFKAGAYDPGSSAGKELLTHELTHVVQQSTGQVPSSGSNMTVRPAGDRFEQAADQAAKQAAGPGSQSPATGSGNIQRDPEAASSAVEEEELATASAPSPARKGAQR